MPSFRSAAPQTIPPDLIGVFVYGTLKQGQCRARHWPTAPTRIVTAWVSGRLFSRADYPAMLAGTDRVGGELWAFSPADLPAVLSVLDQIEGVNQPGEVDEYQRVVVEVQACADPLHRLGRAFAYHYARDPERQGFRRVVPPDPDRLIWWPDATPTLQEFNGGGR